MNLTVTRTGRGHFSVTSESHPDMPNHVDMETETGVPECTCEDYRFRCVPNIKKAQILGTNLFVYEGHNRTICKHGRACIEPYWEELAVRVSKLFNKERV